jgi:hypothetical protein
MFQGLFGKLASSLVILFPVVGGGSTVSVCGEFVEFSSLLVRVTWHSVPVSASALICCASLCLLSNCGHTGLELRLFAR